MSLKRINAVEDIIKRMAESPGNEFELIEKNDIPRSAARQEPNAFRNFRSPS